MPPVGEYALLKAFENVFRGQKYIHRNSTIGDKIAMQLYEDLVALGKSAKLVERVNSQQCVINTGNKMVGKKARRGDGTFGELVPSTIAISEKGFIVARGRIATVEIGAETKIVSKAMIRQVDRVIGDLIRQKEQFNNLGGNPICVAIVGVNFAEHYTSYDGDRVYRTDGKGKHKHPYQEAPQAVERLNEFARPAYDEFQLLRFSATNEEPFLFKWLDYSTTANEYSAMITRISREYDRRFP